LLLNIDMVPWLLRGFLRLLALAAPLFVLFALLGLRGDRRVTFLDTHMALDTDGSAGYLGTPRPGTHIETLTHVGFVVDDAPLWLWALSLLPALLLSVAISVVAWLLLRTMRETYAGEPFSTTGVRRLRRVASVVGIAAVVVPALQAVAEHSIAAHVLPEEGPGLIGRWDVLGETIPWLVAALLLFAIAEAFSVGQRLADDVEGLV
jgi:hypothetical protein